MNLTKTDADAIDEGIAVYDRKMSLPQYAAYKDNPQAAARLFEDCIREALFRNQINARGLEIIKARQAAAIQTTGAQL